MTKDELIMNLAQLWSSKDTEGAHIEADELLLKYINDQEITNAYNTLHKWYA
jgi:hypothetical protein